MGAVRCVVCGPGNRPQATFVSVLLGFEYECPAGHRFLALPSKAHKQDRHYRMKNVRWHFPSLEKRASAVAVLGVRYLIPLMQKGDQRVRLNSDVPLYAPCTGASCCQKVAPALAQLQRLYFVTPNQPESILLRPRIQVLTAHAQHTHTHTHTHPAPRSAHVSEEAR